MISDTKHFFFFCQSTHFYVLHYTQNKYLKKDLYKAQNAYNASRYEGKEAAQESKGVGGREGVLGWWEGGEKERGIKG